MNYYISDTHFSHDNIIKFDKAARPFDTIEQHDEYLIKAWNDLVAPSDNIYHLGDVCFKPKTAIDKILPRLNGIKHLIMGNHDYNALDYTKYFCTIRGSMEKLFTINCNAVHILFTHYPIHPSQIGRDRRYRLNVHGHTHTHSVNDPLYINISCEQTALKPVAENDLLRLMGDRMIKDNINNW